MALIDSLLGLVTGGDPILKAVFAVIFILAAHLGVKLLSHFLRMYWANSDDINRKQVEQRHEQIKYLGYTIDSAIIIMVLFYLDAEITSKISTAFSTSLPNLVSAALIGLLGFVAINLFTRIATESIKSIGARKYFEEVGISSSVFNFISIIIKGFLYLLLIQVVLSEAGVSQSFIRQLITASSWAIAFLIAGLIFYGFKDLVRNFSAGTYLKNTRMLRPGEQIRVNGENAEIKEISSFSTVMNTKKGRTLMMPNSKLMDKDIELKRTKSDLETLEDIKKYFEQDSGSSAAAVSVMALEIFGYRQEQDSVEEKIKEKEAEEVVELFDSLTDGDVKGAFIEQDKITDITAELKTWFKDGGLALMEIDKSELFSESMEEQYVLAIAVEDEEVLIMDPGEEGGGVYYVDKSRITEAMAMTPDPGYIVVAPEGTTSHWRIKKDLIYSDKNLYDELSKNLENRLTKIMRQGRIVKKAMPEKVEEYVESWRDYGDVTRLWSPGDED